MAAGRRLIKLKQWWWWGRRAWPLGAIALIAVLHWLAFFYWWPTHHLMVNKTAALFLQIGGGALVLISIDGNIEKLRSRHMGGELAAWWKDCPAFRKPVVLQPASATLGITASSPKLTATPAIENLEDKVKRLENELRELQKGLNDRLNRLSIQVNDNKAQLNWQILANSALLRTLSSKFDAIAAGGAKIQILGAVLVLYGACISYAT